MPLARAYGVPIDELGPGLDGVDKLAVLLGAEGGGLSDEERARLREVEVGLDVCWDLLRQRRALRNAGLDPSDAATRSEGTVEGYQQ